MRPKHCIMPSTWSLRKSTFHFHATHSHLQGDGDSFKSQSVYKGILSARYNVFTCMIRCLSFQFVPYPIGEFIKTAQKGPVHAGVKVCLTRLLDSLPWSPHQSSSPLPFSLKYFSFFLLLNHLIFSSFLLSPKFLFPSLNFLPPHMHVSCQNSCRKPFSLVSSVC